MRLERFWPGENVERADWIQLTDSEMVRWTGRPSRFTIAIAVVGGSAIALVGVVLSAWLLASPSGDLPGWVGYLPLVLTVVGVGWAALTYVDWLRLLYVVTDEEIYVKYGFVSRDVTQIRLDRVQNTSFDQNVAERIFGFGDVDVYTAGTDTEDLTLRNVPGPERISRLLTELLSEQAAKGERTRPDRP